MFFLPARLSLSQEPQAGLDARWFPSSSRKARASAPLISPKASLTRRTVRRSRLGQSRCHAQGSVDAVFDRAEASFGPVDVLVSNAGFIVSKSVHETSDEEWDQVMDEREISFPDVAPRIAVDDRAARRRYSRYRLDLERGGIAEAGRVLRRKGRPAAARAPDGDRLRQQQYPRQRCRRRLDRYPFSPGYLEGMEDPSAEETAIKNAHPLGRWSQPDEIANAIIFLAGEVRILRNRADPDGRWWLHRALTLCSDKSGDDEWGFRPLHLGGARKTLRAPVLL